MSWGAQIDDDSIRKMFKDGKNYREMAAALGVTKGVIAGKCKRLGLVRNPKRLGQGSGPRVFRTEQEEFERDNRDLKILAAIDNGESQQSASRRFGVSQSYVYELARAAREAQ